MSKRGRKSTLASLTDEDSDGLKHTHFGLRRKQKTSDFDSDYPSGLSNEERTRSNNEQSSSSVPRNKRSCTRDREQILDLDLAATLDGTDTSNRKATFILARTAKSLGQGISTFCINENSIRNQEATL